MSFLQPFILWGLPLALVPVIIHLFNRLRYRTVEWPTMMFLLTASKHASRQARLRELLILACRILAVLALIFFLSRPLVGGWLGWAAGNRADTVIVLLDRSPSMESADPQTRLSKRTLALRRLVEAASEAGGGSRYVLIDSATRQPQEFSSPATLKDLSAAGPSDVVADIPALLGAALDYLQSNPSDRAEIWLCSDLQRSNWQPDAPGWGTVRERFKQQVQSTRVRLLALTQDSQDNLTVRVTGVARRRNGRSFELQITAELTGLTEATFPLTIVHEGARSQMEVDFGGQTMTMQCRLDLGPQTTAGWGWLELPPDTNPRDNQSFFVYPEDLRVKSLVVADSEPAGRLLRIAASPSPLLLNQEAVTQGADSPLSLDNVALLVWQSAAPSGTVETVVRDFAAAGGNVLYLPTLTEEDGNFRVVTWHNSDGPLGKTQDGQDLPLPDVAFAKRTTISSEGSVLAMFDDGKPFLTKQPFGRGAFYYCASLPLPEWSSLGDGAVLVPMVQRMVQEGARRLGHAVNADVGDPQFLHANNLAAADANGAVSAKIVAGVYQQDEKLVALNRAVREDEVGRLDEAGINEVMGPIQYRMFEEKGGDSTAMPSEIWRWFLVAMLAFLTGEAIFMLPAAASKRWNAPDGKRRAFDRETSATGGGA